MSAVPAETVVIAGNSVLAVHQNSTRILVLAVKWLLRDGYSMPLLSFLRFFKHTGTLRKCHVNILSSIPIVGQQMELLMITR